MRPTFLLLLCCTALWACQNDPAADSSALDPEPTTVVIAQEPAIQPDSIFPPTTSGSMDFTTAFARRGDRPSVAETLPGIDIALNHRITGPRGETILIPANSLVDEQGNAVRGNVQVTWSAALTMGEIYTMQAPTVSRGELLGSGGSIYLDAEQNGRPLRIKDGMEWKVTVPSEPITLFPKATMKVFNGQRKRGVVEWSLDPVEIVETVPFRYTYFAMDQRDLVGRAGFARIDSLARTYPARENNSVVAPTPDLAIGKDKAHIAELVLPFYTDPKYRNTYVCSLPFLARLRALTEHIFGLQRTVNDVHYIDERSGANQYIIELLTIYREHADEPLRVPDRIASAWLAKLDVITPKTPSTSAIHIRKLRKAYEDFVAQDLGMPVIIDDRGVDLDAPDAFDQLVRKGLLLETASKTLEQAEDRRTCMEGLKLVQPAEPVNDGTITEQWTQNLPDGRRAVVRKRQTYSVRYTGGFGYINCDRFIGPEFAAPSNVFVTIDGPELNYERVSMFFPSINGCMDLVRDADARIYRLPLSVSRLPHGQPMALLVVGKTADGYAYHLQAGTISEKVSARLQPRAGDMAELMERLAGI